MKRRRHSPDQIIAELREAKGFGANGQDDYNHRRPHSLLGHQTPAAYAATCARTHRVAALGAPPPNPRPGRCPRTPVLLLLGVRYRRPRRIENRVRLS